MAEFGGRNQGSSSFQQGAARREAHRDSFISRMVFFNWRLAKN
jgi:hypothetical protein